MVRAMSFDATADHDPVVRPRRGHHAPTILNHRRWKVADLTTEDTGITEKTIHAVANTMSRSSPL